MMDWLATDFATAKESLCQWLAGQKLGRGAEHLDRVGPTISIGPSILARYDTSLLWQNYPRVVAGQQGGP